MSEATWKPSMKALEKERKLAYENSLRRQNSQATPSKSVQSPLPPPHMGEYSIANLVKYN